MSAAVASFEIAEPELGSQPLLCARLLGRFSVTLDGFPVDTLSSRRTRNVIAYLLVHRRVPVTRDALMDAFWPHADPESARNCLHVALSGARHALRGASAAPVLQRARDTYFLGDCVRVWVDVEEFERQCRAGHRAELAGDDDEAVRCYEAAAQLYDGDFLADDPYAEWTTTTREGLRLLALDAQSRLVELYVRRGAYGPAIQTGRWILAEDPCNEPMHRRLMACYASVGQRHLALSQYRRCGEAMWDAFRAGPSAETTRLYERLRSGGTLSRSA
jgi:SARP family transcriptional regulator, regulator of embCAB operon